MYYFLIYFAIGSAMTFLMADTTKNTVRFAAKNIGMDKDEIQKLMNERTYGGKAFDEFLQTLLLILFWPFITFVTFRVINIMVKQAAADNVLSDPDFENKAISEAAAEYTEMLFERGLIKDPSDKKAFKSLLSDRFKKVTSKFKEDIDKGKMPTKDSVSAALVSEAKIAVIELSVKKINSQLDVSEDENG